MVNPQINCWLVPFPQDISIVMKTKYPVHIRVFGVVTNDYYIIPSVIASESKEIVVCWIKWLATGRLYIWQQNSAPCYTSRRIPWNPVRTWCFTSGHLTPQIALPLIMMCEAWLTNKSLCNSKDELKLRIIAAFTNSNKEKFCCTPYIMESPSSINTHRERQEVHQSAQHNHW